MASSSSPSKCEDPTEVLKKEPAKGILKPSVSYEEKDKKKSNSNKSTKWDEMNIIKTLHPPDKDYGHMKVDEPKTPYERGVDVGDDDEMDGGVNAEELTRRIKEGGERRSNSFDSEESEEDDESPENKIAREVFQQKRKEHYNEFQTAKILAQQLMDEEDEDENDDNKQNDACLV